MQGAALLTWWRNALRQLGYGRFAPTSRFKITTSGSVPVENYNLEVLNYGFGGQPECSIIHKIHWVMCYIWFTGLEFDSPYSTTVDGATQHFKLIFLLSFFSRVLLTQERLCINTCNATKCLILFIWSFWSFFVFPNKDMKRWFEAI